MKKIKSSFSGAIRRTLKEEMEADERIFLLGEDIADPYGGIHNATKGLSKLFQERVINSPISEIAISGTGVGAAMVGMRPVIEIMYADFLPIAMDQIVNHAAKIFFLSCGRTKAPLVVRTSYGSGKAEGAMNSQCPEAWFINFPGLKIVVPSTTRDVQGLLKSSIEEQNPVIFLEHKLLYPLKGEILEKNKAIPLGRGEIKRKGRDLTITCCSIMVHRSLQAAKELEKEGIDVEVMDLRTLKPLDKTMLLQSVHKTGRLLTVEESPYTGGWGAQIIQIAVEKAFYSFKTPPQRLTTPDLSLPARKDFEEFLVPQVNDIVKKVKEIMKESGSIKR